MLSPVLFHSLVVAWFKFDIWQGTEFRIEMAGGVVQKRKVPIGDRNQPPVTFRNMKQAVTATYGRAIRCQRYSEVQTSGACFAGEAWIDASLHLSSV